MNDISKSIGYSRYSWNPVSGCRHSCDWCYARRIAQRFRPKRVGMREIYDGIVIAEPGDVFPVGFEPTFYEHRLSEPAQVKQPALVFVGDMCDLWGEWVPRWLQRRVLDACAAAGQHTYLMLTKAPRGYPSWLPSNIWPGTTIESVAKLWRLHYLRKVDAPLRWLSLEPLLSSLGHLDLSGIGWVVVGAQTGPGARPPELAWVAEVLRQCEAAGVPVYMKSNLVRVWGPDLIRQWPAGAPIVREEAKSEG